MPLIFIPREQAPLETRVSASPESVRRLSKAGWELLVQADAGKHAGWADAEYAEAGAGICTRPEGFARADVVLHVAVPTVEDFKAMKSGASSVGFVWAREHPDELQAARNRRLSVFAMDAIPRISRAQKYDALSSQANLAGYKAVLLAAHALPKLFPLLMTAAGTVRPARVVIIGAGVAGLQAIATARRLGALVEVSDVRKEVKEQVQSLGASYIDVPDDEDLSGEGGYAREQSEAHKRRQQGILAQRIAAADVVVCTALIPYRPAPKLVTRAMVAAMRSGSVIVDLAAERGGNCEVTVAGQSIRTEQGVTVIGALNLAASVPVHASELYARNLEGVLLDCFDREHMQWKMQDEVVKGALVMLNGEAQKV